MLMSPETVRTVTGLPPAPTVPESTCLPPPERFSLMVIGNPQVNFPEVERASSANCAFEVSAIVTSPDVLGGVTASAHGRCR